MLKKSLFLAFMGLFLLMGVGCCPITRLNISIEVDESFRTAYGNRPVQVDVVGVRHEAPVPWGSIGLPWHLLEHGLDEKGAPPGPFLHTASNGAAAAGTLGA